MRLFEHQRKGLEETADKNRVAYYWDMGTGKTFVGSEKLMQLGGRINLVVCQKSKIDDWVQHFREHYNVLDGMNDFDYLLYDLTDTDRLYCFITNAKI